MSEIYRFSGLELDAARFQIRRDGKALTVQPQVFDVLHTWLPTTTVSSPRTSCSTKSGTVDLFQKPRSAVASRRYSS